MPIYGNDGLPTDNALGGTAVPNPSEVEMFPVESSHISEIGYDENSFTLMVRFYNGALYEYYDVSYDLYEGLLYATSKGIYLNQNIKVPGYAFNRVE